MKCAIETCPLVRVKIRHLGRHMIGHEKSMGMAGDQIHAINSQEIDENRCIRHNDGRAYADHYPRSSFVCGLRETQERIIANLKRFAQIKDAPTGDFLATIGFNRQVRDFVP